MEDPSKRKLGLSSLLSPTTKSMTDDQSAVITRSEMATQTNIMFS